ncbi:hypothetical protein DEIPH_ctg052orf0024 [Deinococcus phoenicis]|uniref:Uncharacterized protein n=1 Tax=Deinococcus phoenicis TaxID=1476583 RepID=A0A016QLW9_9DEIO|nr:hypothetical protein [Deinococcus phoenicis]EYB67028.1 hypothetical protein DEIPH_ctg052orf0024 [Deinococcus phoenicis]
MPKVTISPKADIDAKGHTAVQITGLKALVDLDPCTPVKIVADANGNFRATVAKAGDVCDGISSPKKTLAGQPVTVFGVGMRFHASDAGALTPGLYGLTVNAREVDSAAHVKVFRAVSKTDLQVIAVA